MTTLIDRAEVRPSTTPVQRLRTTTAAVRLSFTWFGVRKTLTPVQKAIAAESFGAEGNFLSAGKKLLDVKLPAFRAVTAIRGRAVAYWKGVSLPFPESGVRLIHQDRLKEFDERMNELKDQLTEAVANLDEHYAELKVVASQRLGSLYDENDYPASFRGWFGMEWNFPSIEPPDYLMQLNPRLYEQERARVSARFDEAVRIAETAFTEEFSKLVSHLCERIGGTDGKPKIFRDSAVRNLLEFFDRFRQLSIHSSDELDELVGRAQSLVEGVLPQDLREDDDLRQRFSDQLSQVQSSLNNFLIDRPRRRILRGLVRNGGE